jgi:hypothetical protein
MVPNFKQWLELVSPPVSIGNNETTNEEPTAEDYNFYHTHLSGKIKIYLTWLTELLEKQGQKLNLIRKGFIVQEVMDSLGLNPQQVTRLSTNIKKGLINAQHAKPNHVSPSADQPGLPTGPMP